MKHKKIGAISFTAEGYEQFTTKTKEEQLEQVYNSLTPKDYTMAEKLLKDIPHGKSIVRGDEKKDAGDNIAGASGGSGKDSTGGRKSGSAKS